MYAQTSSFVCIVGINAFVALVTSIVLLIFGRTVIFRLVCMILFMFFCVVRIAGVSDLNSLSRFDCKFFSSLSQRGSYYDPKFHLSFRCTRFLSYPLNLPAVH